MNVHPLRGLCADYRRLLMLVLLLVGQCMVATYALPSDDDVIVPGQRVGPVSIGMGPKEILRALGVPDPSGRTQYGVYEYKAKGLELVTRDDKIVRININSGSYHFSNGLHVGSSVLEMLAIEGEPSWKNTNYPGFTEYCFKDETEFVASTAGQAAGQIVSIAIAACSP